MDRYVKQSVSTRVDFFEQYLVVPEDAAREVADFVRDVTALGERSADVAAFEAEFAACGLSERFNSLVSRCTPRAHEMTDEERAHSRQTAREILKEDHPHLGREIAAEVLDDINVAAEEEIIAAGREAMIENEVFTDYTHASNAAEYAGGALSFIARLFKRKK